MLEVLIVGGGIHGIYLANRLVVSEGLPLDRIMIIDPHDVPGQRWKELTARTGMRFLRSPIVHHVDVDPWSLSKYMKLPDVKPWASTLGETERPSLRLFNSHIDHVVDKSGIYKAYRRGTALAMKDCGSHLLVETTAGAVRTRRVILAISSNENPRMPDWAMALIDKGATLRNVFEAGFSFHSISPSYSYAIVGSGLSAVQLALAVGRLSPGKTTLITKGTLEVNALDFDPCWIGPKCQEPFAKIKDYAMRRAELQKARFTGTVPEPIYKAFGKALAEGRVKHLTSRAEGGRVDSDGRVELQMADGGLLMVDRVLFAIGFEKAPPGSTWLQAVADDIGLNTHTDGYPIVDSSLRWHDRIFVSGALAELEVGAASRNVIGARIAGDRICPALK